MSKSLFILGILGLAFASCGDKGKDISELQAIGGAVYGGNFRLMSPEKITSMLPQGTLDVFTSRVTTQLFETLLRLDPSGTKVIPSLAESFTVSENGKTYTFKIRKGVMFHGDDCIGSGGRELTAADVKYALDFSCSGLKLNKMSTFLTDKIVGGAEFFKKSTKAISESGVKGIKVIDANTLQIELVDPIGSFDKMMTHNSLGVFPKEAYEKYGNDITKHPVGSGAFALDTWDENKIVLKRNNNYWKKDELGNQLPFLASITLTYSTNKRSELMAFREEKIEMVSEIPVEEIENVLGTLQEAQQGKNVKHKVINISSMSINYFGFANNSGVFKDVKVRKAFNLGINRQSIVDKWLLGEGYPCENGFVPAIDGYSSTSVNGYVFDAARAKGLLAEAGYPNGVGFPETIIYINAKEGTGNYRMAEGVVSEIEANLGVKIKIKVCTIEERDAAVSSGTALFWRTGWVADYPDPENFLSLFLQKNISENNATMNPFKYMNPKFDKVFDAAMKEKNFKKRMELFVQCDQMIIDDAVVMPLLTDDFIIMYNSKIRKLETNSMEQLDFSNIFIKEIRE